jgi:DNA topoisomerase-2
MIDGLKPSQRKIVFAALQKDIVDEIKVFPFIGYVCESTGYYHGEESLAATLILMAQRYVGKCNINLLEPIGQFGTRRSVSYMHKPLYLFILLLSIYELLRRPRIYNNL